MTQLINISLSGKVIHTPKYELMLFLYAMLLGMQKNENYSKNKYMMHNACEKFHFVGNFLYSFTYV